MLYLFIVIYLIFLVYRYDLSYRIQGKREHERIVLLLLILISGLRYRMAPDSVTLEFEFDNLFHPLGSSYLYDSYYGRAYQPFWIFINSFCKTLGNYSLFQLVCETIIHINIFFFIRNISNYVFTILFLYFTYDYFYLNMDVMREFLAVSFELSAFIFLIKGKLKRMLLFSVTAVMIHIGAVFFTLILISLYFKPNRIFFVVIGAFFVVVIAFSDSIIYTGINYLSAYKDLTEYIEADLNKISIAGYLYKLSPAVFYIVISFLSKKTILLNTKDNYIISCLSVLFISLVFARYSIPFIERIFNYFVFFNYVLVAYGLYEFFPNYVKIKRKLCFSIIIFFSMFNLVLFCSKSNLGIPVYYRYYPYNSIFTKKYIVERERIVEAENRIN